MSSNELKQTLLDLIIMIDRNAVATDDDLRLTWYHVKTHWNKTKQEMDDYIMEGES